MVTIDRDIPIPSDVGRRVGRLYPFSDLNVNESFAWPANSRGSLYQAAKAWRARHPGWRFHLSSIRDAEDGTVRLWRTG